jgi:hypothetical protein
MSNKIEITRRYTSRNGFWYENGETMGSSIISIREGLCMANYNAVDYPEGTKIKSTTLTEITKPLTANTNP